MISKLRTVYYSQVATHEGRDLTLRQAPAVYAWFRSLRLSDALGTPQMFLARLRNLLAASLSDHFDAHLGYLYRVSLREHPTCLGPGSNSALDAIAGNYAARRRLAAILESTVDLQAPLYIGKALDLQRRVGEHVSGASGLVGRFEACGIRLDDCILRFRYVEKAELAEIVAPLLATDNGSTEDIAVRLVEELATRLAPAAFVRRPG